ncbi:hypothetical protein CBER1_02696 [Cercospora berteroae]|uniref:Apple domain-containing protein n=1 Tax=Cercospora berteroae TaxID=357750 RepID=A0A2S6CJT7_9PEZI|nr:hypothetical protein CBER1_02696 [Cercospora berteroae]
MRSSAIVAIGLSLIHASDARVTNTPAGPQQRDAEPSSTNIVRQLFNRLFKKAAAATCYQDNYYTFLNDPEFGSSFCQQYLTYSNTTVTVARTPVSTYTDIYSTQSFTQRRVTTVPAATVTVTATPGLSERDASPAPAQGFSDEQIADALLSFRRMANADNASDETVSASFASACACHNFPGPTVTTTYTAQPRVLTLSAYEQETTTIVATATAGTVTTTVRAGTPPASDDSTVPSPSSQTSPNAPAPTTPGFQCPEDDNSVVSQLIGYEKFDYLVKCDTDITDPDFYNVLSFNSYSECAAACSTANQRFDVPVCKGFSFYDARSNQGYNCFLKGAANTTVPAIGVDSGILQRVLVGITPDTPAGTNTESAPFSSETATLDPEEASSSMSEIFSDSSTSISVVTPQVPISGLLVDAPGETIYSTYISDGSTYSSGTVFSTYFTQGGVWYFSYYTAYTQSWASATTVFAGTSSGSTISNVTSSGVVESAGAGGQSVVTTTTNTTQAISGGGYNTTSVIVTTTYAPNGTELSASTTTLYYFETGSASSVGGGGSGGISSNSAGVITSASSWSTIQSSQVVISGGGGGVGGGSGTEASGVVQTPAPSVVTNAGNTYFSSGFVASGADGGTAGASSTAASGVVPSNVTSSSPRFTPISATSGETGIGGASSTEASGVIPQSSVPLSPVSSTSGQTGFYNASSTAASGVVPSSDLPPTPISSTNDVASTAYASSTEASGSSPFSNTRDNRSNTRRSSTRFPTTLGVSSLSSADQYESQTEGGSSTSTSAPNVFTESIPVETGSVPFSAPSGPRSRTSSLGANSTGPFVTSPSTDTPPTVTNSESVTSSSGGVPFTNSLGSRSGTRSRGTSTTTGVPYTNSLGSRSATRMSGTAPSVPFGTGPSSLPSTTTNATPPASQTAPSSSGSVPFSAPSGPRSGTRSRTSSRTAPSGTTPPGTGSSSSTAPVTFPPFPTTSSNTCVTQILGTTTIFTTVTEYGCYSNCPPSGFQGYGDRPQSFGPPAQATGRGGYYGRPE